MRKNIGKRDRILRLSIGTAALFAGVIFKNPILVIIGIFTLYEAFSGWCAFYQVLGKNTCPIKDPEKRKVEFRKQYLAGLAILTSAIITNILAKYLGLATWYDVFYSPEKIPDLTLTNWFFLLIIYPMILSYSGYYVFKRT